MRAGCAGTHICEHRALLRCCQAHGSAGPELPSAPQLPEGTALHVRHRRAQEHAGPQLPMLPGSLTPRWAVLCSTLDRVVPGLSPGPHIGSSTPDTSCAQPQPQAPEGSSIPDISCAQPQVWGALQEAAPRRLQDVPSQRPLEQPAAGQPWGPSMPGFPQPSDSTRPPTLGSWSTLSRSDAAESNTAV